MSGFILRLIAVLTMVTDHVTDVFRLSSAGNLIGRLAFPLYAFMIVDSFRHLAGKPERMRKFMVALAVMAVVSEPAFDYAFYRTFFSMNMQNQLLQYLTFGIAFLWTRRIRTPWLRFAVWTATTVLNQVLLMGYFGSGILLMLMQYWYLERYEAHSPAWRFICCSVMMLLFYLLLVPDTLLGTIQMWGWRAVQPAIRRSVTYYLQINLPVLATVPLLAMYNGQYGSVPRLFRKCYRYFYPAHLWVLTSIRLLFRI